MISISTKGPNNIPIFINNIKDFEKVFGNINKAEQIRKLRKKKLERLKCHCHILEHPIGNIIV